MAGSKKYDKSKPDQSGYRQLKQDIRDKNLGKLYFLHGEETYLRDYYFGEMKKQLLDGGMGTFNLHQLEGKELSPHKLEEVVDCLPMMADRTLIVVSDFDFFKAGESDREKYGEIFENLPDYCCLVAIYDLIAFKADARLKLSKTVKKVGHIVHFAPQEQSDLVDWIRRRFKALDKDIDSRLAMELIFLCGDLMTKLATEIEKIGAYAKGARITREDMDAVATPQLDAVVFQMTNYMGEGNFDGAMEVLGKLYQMQEPPVKIMYMVSRQMRQLYGAKLAQEHRQTTAQLAAMLSIQNYPAEKLSQSARRFSLPWCRRGVIRCGQVDLAMKSATGLDNQALLTGLLIELAASGRAS